MKKENSIKTLIKNIGEMIKESISDYKKSSPKKNSQSKASKMDESLGMRRGKESTKKQSYKSRRDESLGAKKKKVTVAKGVKVSKATEKRMEKKAGSSNVGEYKKVSPKDFAGSAGGSSEYSYPINTKKRAKAALSYARNAPNPSGIKKSVYKKYPDLKPKKK